MATIAQLFSGMAPPPPDAPRSLRELFDQGKWWKGRDGWIRVKDMTPAHRLNAARVLLDRAALYAEAFAWSDYRFAFGAPDEVVDSVFHEMEQRDADPAAWMRNTKLYRKIIKGVKIDASPTDYR
jgi:hypothetical protein